MNSYNILIQTRKLINKVYQMQNFNTCRQTHWTGYHFVRYHLVENGRFYQKCLKIFEIGPTVLKFEQSLGYFGYIACLCCINFPTRQHMYITLYRFVFIYGITELYMAFLCQIRHSYHKMNLLLQFPINSQFYFFKWQITIISKIGLNKIYLISLEKKVMT